MLDGWNEQWRIRPRFVDGDVRHDAAVCFLDLHQDAELRRPCELPLTDDLRPRLEDADDLARSAGLSAQHASASLSDHLTTMTRDRRNDADQLGDIPSASASGCSQLLFGLFG